VGVILVNLLLQYGLSLPTPLQVFRQRTAPQAIKPTRNKEAVVGSGIFTGKMSNERVSEVPGMTTLPVKNARTNGEIGGHICVFSFCSQLCLGSTPHRARPLSTEGNITFVNGKPILDRSARLEEEFSSLTRTA
jgi:hypothetical protein